MRRRRQRAGAVATTPAPRRPAAAGRGSHDLPGEARRRVLRGAAERPARRPRDRATSARAAAKLKRAARAYATPHRSVLPAFELISTIANAHPGDDGMYRTHQPPSTINTYLAAARKAKALLVLDIQPGRGDFLSEAQRLEPWLLQPDVGLALDPEWHVADPRRARPDDRLRHGRGGQPGLPRGSAIVTPSTTSRRSSSSCTSSRRDGRRTRRSSGARAAWRSR